MIVKLRTEHHLEFLSLKGGCTGSSESTLVKMSNCWKSHAAAHWFWLVSVRCMSLSWPTVPQLENFLSSDYMSKCMSFPTI